MAGRGIIPPKSKRSSPSQMTKMTKNAPHHHHQSNHTQSKYEKLIFPKNAKKKAEIHRKEYLNNCKQETNDKLTEISNTNETGMVLSRPPPLSTKPNYATTHEHKQSHIGSDLSQPSTQKTSIAQSNAQSSAQSMTHSVTQSQQSSPKRGHSKNIKHIKHNRNSKNGKNESNLNENKSMKKTIANGHEIVCLNQYNEWVAAKDPLHYDKPETIGVGPGLSFAKFIAATDVVEKKRKIGLIPCAVGGTSIEEWMPPKDGEMKQLLKALDSLIKSRNETPNNDTNDIDFYSNDLETLGSSQVTTQGTTQAATQASTQQVTSQATGANTMSSTLNENEIKRDLNSKDENRDNGGSSSSTEGTSNNTVKSQRKLSITNLQEYEREQALSESEKQEQTIEHKKNIDDISVAATAGSQLNSNVKQLSKPFGNEFEAPTNEEEIVDDMTPIVSTTTTTTQTKNIYENNIDNKVIITPEIAYCNKQNVKKDLFKRCIVRTLLAINDKNISDIRIRAILWHQGESDAGNVEQSKNYIINIIDLINAFRNYLGNEHLPVLVGGLADFLGENPDLNKSNQFMYYPVINNALQSLPQRLHNVAFVSSKKLSHKGDYLHFDSDSAQILGHRYAIGLAQLSGSLTNEEYNRLTQIAKALKIRSTQAISKTKSFSWKEWIGVACVATIVGVIALREYRRQETNKPDSVTKP